MTSEKLLIACSLCQAAVTCLQHESCIAQQSRDQQKHSARALLTTTSRHSENNKLHGQQQCIVAAEVSASSFMQHHVWCQLRSSNKQGTNTVQKRQTSAAPAVLYATACMHAWLGRAIRRACMVCSGYLLLPTPLPGCKHHMLHATLHTNKRKKLVVQKHMLPACVASSRLLPLNQLQHPLC